MRSESRFLAYFYLLCISIMSLFSIRSIYICSVVLGNENLNLSFETHFCKISDFTYDKILLTSICNGTQ